MRILLIILGTVLVLGVSITVFCLYIAVGVLVVSGSWGGFVNALLVGLVPVIALVTLLLIPDRYYEGLI